MKTTVFLVSALILGALIMGGCSETSPGPDNQVDHDVVTTVTFTLRPTTGGTDSLVYVWEDIDGVGGNGPNRIDTMKLKAGVLYSCSVKLENRSVSPTMDITSEIEEQLDNHQFIYTLPVQYGTVTILDKDSRNLPVGLNFDLQSTTDAELALSTFMMSLYHYENATDKVAGVPGSETDVSIEMPVRVLE